MQLLRGLKQELTLILNVSNRLPVWDALPDFKENVNSL